MRNYLLTLALIITGILSAGAQVFYKIEGNGLEKPSYILGTHHLAPLSNVDSIAGLHEALRDVTQVVGEIDMTIDQMTLGLKMQGYMVAPSDSTLSSLLDPETYNRVSEEFRLWAPMPGMELPMLDAFKPQVITTMVAVGMVQREMPGFNPQEQLDTYFQLQGRELGHKIVPLETPEQQAEILYSSTPIAEQVTALVEMLDDPEKQMVNIRRLNEAYKAHDIDTLLSLTRDEDANPEFMERLLNERNTNWLKELPAIMSEGPAFIVVGALHLPGEQGVLEGLRKAGYTVTSAE
ncbi:MAG: TraB/GumN family protein [Muribaculaceae bacterium]|nr:TraB/GumN family protein [Muribaculaceae bacterium]